MPPALNRKSLINRLFGSPRASGSDFAVSAKPTSPTQYEVRFHIAPDRNPLGTSNIKPDTEMHTLAQISGNGTVFRRPSPNNGPALVSGEIIPVNAIIDPSGQIDFGEVLGGTVSGQVDPNFPLATLNGGPW